VRASGTSSSAVFRDPRPRGDPFLRLLDSVTSPTPPTPRPSPPTPFPLPLPLPLPFLLSPPHPPLFSPRFSSLHPVLCDRTTSAWVPHNSSLPGLAPGQMRLLHHPQGILRLFDRLQIRPAERQCRMSGGTGLAAMSYQLVKSHMSMRLKTTGWEQLRFETPVSPRNVSRTTRRPHE
jgi:hypothetical protein